MAGYEIGLSGMHAAQKALDIIGNNIANAATEGYHLQEVNLQPADESYTSGQMVGQGVEYIGVRRLIDDVLEAEMLRHESTLSELERKLDTLSSMESAFGELSTDGLSTSIDEFFGAFQDLAIRPQDVNLQSSVLSSAESLASQFRNLGEIISNMEEMMYAEAQSSTERVNYLAAQIADLNKEVYSQKMRGYDASNTMDQRDGLITELGGLIGLTVVKRDTGMMDITASNISLVVGSVSTEVEVGLETTNDGYSILGLRPTDTEDVGQPHFDALGSW